jgi:hypothetical protein
MIILAPRMIASSRGAEIGILENYFFPSVSQDDTQDDPRMIEFPHLSLG